MHLYVAFIFDFCLIINIFLGGFMLVFCSPSLRSMCVFSSFFVFFLFDQAAFVFQHELHGAAAILAYLLKGWSPSYFVEAVGLYFVSG